MTEPRDSLRFLKLICEVAAALPVDEDAEADFDRRCAELYPPQPGRPIARRCKPNDVEPS
jgi:hypothetical protein